MGNAFALVAGRVAGDAALLAFMLLYARSYGASALGQYALAMSVAGVLSIATSLGLNTVLQRELSRAPARSREISGAMLLPQFAAALLGAGLIVAASLLWFEPGATRQAIWIMGAYHLLARLAQAVAARFAGHEQMATWSALEAAHKVGILLIALLGFRGAWDSTHVLMAYPAMGAALLASGWLVSSRRYGAPILGLGTGNWRPVLALGLPFLAIQFVLEFYDRIGVVMLESVRGAAETGLYAAADRPLTIFTAGLNLLAGAMLPALSRLFVHDRRQLVELYDTGARVAFLLSLPIAVVIALEADWLVRVLFDRGFEATAPVLAVLAWTLPFLAIRFIACTALVATEQQRFLFRHGMCCRSYILDRRVAVDSDSRGHGAGSVQTGIRRCFRCGVGGTDRHGDQEHVVASINPRRCAGGAGHGGSSFGRRPMGTDHGDCGRPAWRSPRYCY